MDIEKIIIDFVIKLITNLITAIFNKIIDNNYKNKKDCKKK